MAPYDRGGTRFTLPRTVMDQSHLPSYAYRVIACRTVHDMSGGQHQPRRDQATRAERTMPILVEPDNRDIRIQKVRAQGA
jgi:hypothetical protein